LLTFARLCHQTAPQISCCRRQHSNAFANGL
jgi:hypothetical protein